MPRSKPKAQRLPSPCQRSDDSNHWQAPFPHLGSMPRSRSAPTTSPRRSSVPHQVTIQTPKADTRRSAPCSSNKETAELVFAAEGTSTKSPPATIYLPSDAKDTHQVLRDNGLRNQQHRPSPISLSNTCEEIFPMPRPEKVVKRVDGAVDEGKSRGTPAACAAPALTVSLKGAHSKKRARNSSSCTIALISDREAKSIFDAELDDCNQSYRDGCRRKIDKNRQRKYWKELETISIRKTRENAGAVERNEDRRAKDKLKKSNRANNMSVRRSSLANVVVDPTSALPLSPEAPIKRKEPYGKRLTPPITEEHLDGSDAIPSSSYRKKKVARTQVTSERRRQPTLFEESKMETLSRGKKANGTNGDEKSRGIERRLKVHRFSADANWAKALRRHSRTRPDDDLDMRRTEHSEQRVESASSTGFSECDGQACMECEGLGKASKMVLCDACSDGCHIFCMRPARSSIPLGIWMCPRCHVLAKKHAVHLSRLREFIEGQDSSLHGNGLSTQDQQVVHVVS